MTYRLTALTAAVCTTIGAGLAPVAIAYAGPSAAPAATLAPTSVTRATDILWYGIGLSPSLVARFEKAVTQDATGHYVLDKTKVPRHATATEIALVQHAIAQANAMLDASRWSRHCGWCHDHHPKPHPPRPTATVTVTTTATVTATTTATVTATVTVMPTPTGSPTATETPKPTVTVTPTPTATETPTRTGSPTATETPKPTATETPSPTETVTPSPTGGPTSTPAPTTTPHGAFEVYWWGVSVWMDETLTAKVVALLATPEGQAKVAALLVQQLGLSREQAQQLSGSLASAGAKIAGCSNGNGVKIDRPWSGDVTCTPR